MAVNAGLVGKNDAVDVVFISPVKGKGLIARRSIKEGEVLFRERPLVCTQFAWNEAYKYKACEFCLKSLETAEEKGRRLTGDPSLVLPYPECCDVDPSKYAECPHCEALYCSAACLDAAWNSYHQVLCPGQSKNDPEHPLNRLINEWKAFHLPPETTSIMLIVKLIAIIKQAKDKEAVKSTLSTFVQTTVNVQENFFHKMLGQEFEVQREVLRNMLKEDFYEEAVQEWYTPGGFNNLFALIGTNAQGIGTSSFSRWVKATDELELEETERQQLETTLEQMYEVLEDVSGDFLNCEGSGLYKLQSSANHSCVPNTEIIFDDGDHTLSLVAVDDIDPGEEVCISYLGCCDLGRGRHTRQKGLRENYLFHCCCERCEDEADDASITSDEEEFLRELEEENEKS